MPAGSSGPPLGVRQEQYTILGKKTLFLRYVIFGIQTPETEKNFIQSVKQANTACETLINKTLGITYDSGG